MNKWIGFLLFVSLIVPTLEAVADCTSNPYGYVPYDSSTMNFQVSPDQAVLIAQTWCGNPALSFSLLVACAGNSLGHSFYVVNSSDKQELWIACDNGTVLRWESTSAGVVASQSEQQNNTTPLTPISSAQMLQIAMDFIQAHYPALAGANLVVSDQNQFSVTLRSQINGVWCDDSWCVVNLDSFTGTVFSCGARCGSVPSISLQPGLTAAQSESIAVNSLANAEGVAIAFTFLPSELREETDVFGQQTLVWVVHVGTNEDPNIDPSQYQGDDYLGGTPYDVDVDANTGNILYTTGFLGAPRGHGPRHPHWRSRFKRFPKGRKTVISDGFARVVVDGEAVHGLAHPPVVRYGTAYWYAGYLQSSVWRLKVVADRNGLRVTYPDRKTRSVPLLGAVAKVGKSPPAIVVGGRAYIAPATLAALTGYKARWVSSTHTLELERKGKILMQ